MFRKKTPPVYGLSSGPMIVAARAPAVSAAEEGAEGGGRVARNVLPGPPRARGARGGARAGPRRRGAPCQ